MYLTKLDSVSSVTILLAFPVSFNFLFGKSETIHANLCLRLYKAYLPSKRCRGVCDMFSSTIGCKIV